MIKTDYFRSPEIWNSAHFYRSPYQCQTYLRVFISGISWTRAGSPFFPDEDSPIAPVLVPTDPRLTNHGYLSIHSHFDFPRSRGNSMGGSPSCGPSDFDTGRGPARAHHLHGAVLGPVAAAGMNFSNWPQPRTRGEPELRSDSPRIAKRSSQLHSQSRLCADIPKKFRLRSVLCHNQLEPPVTV